tara:strand:+ start:17582 stop:17779 length:198 start_codon:yes stop_codon:yes gene_type:complete
MKRIDRYKHALQVARDHDNIIFEASILAELKLMEKDEKLANEEVNTSTEDEKLDSEEPTTKASNV